MLLVLLGALAIRLAAPGSCRLFTGAGFRPLARLPLRLAGRAVETATAEVGAATLAEGILGPKAEEELNHVGLPPLRKRTFLVTGATSGIGRATVEMLAKEGCTILVHGRDEGRMRHLMDKFGRLYRNATFDGFEADLSSMEDVEEMVELIRERHPVIHGILHNAATMDGGLSGKKKITWEQEEQTIAVNVLAPFLLTAGLLPNLRASGAGRVIFSGSATMTGGQYLDDLDFERKWSGIHAYSLSKLADAMMAEEMHQRYGDAPRLTFHSIDPGMADTKLARHGVSFARGHRKGRAQTVQRLVYGTLPNAKTAKASFKALTEDAFQETSGGRLDTENGQKYIEDAAEREILWEELERRTEAEWPVPPKLLAAAGDSAKEAAVPVAEDAA